MICPSCGSDDTFEVDEDVIETEEIEEGIEVPVITVVQWACAACSCVWEQ